MIEGWLGNVLITGPAAWLSGVVRFRAMSSPEPALTETRERRCPYCKNERVAPAGRVIVGAGFLKEELRCEVCGLGFVFVRKPRA